MDKAVYLFCLARGTMLPEFQMEGLDRDAPLLKEDISNVTAVLCEVSLDEFSGPSADERLQDLTWVGPRAVRHGEVIELVMRHSPVLPVRFGTLFSSVDSLRRLLERNLEQISEFLDWVTGKREWAVKVLLSRTEVTNRLVAERLGEQSEALSTLSQGMRYFKERQIRAAVDKEMGGWIKTVLKTASSQFVEASADWHRRDIVFRTQEGTDLETVANWAFLVEQAHEDRFKARVDEANTKHSPFGLSFQLSGPWPPYSFTPALETEAPE